MEKELDEILTTAARDDGTDPEFEELWSSIVHQAIRPPPQLPAPVTTKATGKPPTDKPRPVTVSTIRPLNRPPRVGTLVQRSSGDQARKLAMLMAPRHHYHDSTQKGRSGQFDRQQRKTG